MPCCSAQAIQHVADEGDGEVTKSCHLGVTAYAGFEGAHGTRVALARESASSENDDL